MTVPRSKMMTDEDRRLHSVFDEDLGQMYPFMERPPQPLPSAQSAMPWLRDASVYDPLDDGHAASIAARSTHADRHLAQEREAKHMLIPDGMVKIPSAREEARAAMAPNDKAIDAILLRNANLARSGILASPQRQVSTDRPARAQPDDASTAVPKLGLTEQPTPHTADIDTPFRALGVTMSEAPDRMRHMQHPFHEVNMAKVHPNLFGTAAPQNSDEAGFFKSAFAPPSAAQQPPLATEDTVVDRTSITAPSLPGVQLSTSQLPVDPDRDFKDRVEAAMMTKWLEEHGHAGPVYGPDIMRVGEDVEREGIQTDPAHINTKISIKFPGEAALFCEESEKANRAKIAEMEEGTEKEMLWVKRLLIPMQPRGIEEDGVSSVNIHDTKRPPSAIFMKTKDKRPKIPSKTKPNPPPLPNAFAHCSLHVNPSMRGDDTSLFGTFGPRSVHASTFNSANDGRIEDDGMRGWMSKMSTVPTNAHSFGPSELDALRQDPSHHLQELDDAIHAEQQQKKDEDAHVYFVGHRAGAAVSHKKEEPSQELRWVKWD